MERYIKLESKSFPNVILRVTPGHFVTPGSHVNYYRDTVPMKSRMSEAKAVAAALAHAHIASTPVDSIVCLDDMETVGAYLAEELTRAGTISMNMHNTIYVLKPDHAANGQIIFRENIYPWIKGKNVLLLSAISTTGSSAGRAVDALNYYGATITGISAIFSSVSKIAGMEVHALFTRNDLPKYASYEAKDCPMCREKQKIDAMCNSLGYTKL